MIVLLCLDLMHGDLLVVGPYSSRQPSQTTTSSGNGTVTWNSTTVALDHVIAEINQLCSEDKHSRFAGGNVGLG